MKKLILLTAFLLLFGCSKNDNSDPIVGTWKPTVLIVDGVIIEDFALNSCRDQMRQIFSANFSYTNIIYQGTPEDCEEFVKNSQWKNTNGQYYIKNIGDVYSPIDIEFIDNNTFKYYLEEIPGDKTKYIEYIRIN